MQKNLKRTCERALAGLFLSALVTGSGVTFADEAASSSQLANSPTQAALSAATSVNPISEVADQASAPGHSGSSFLSTVASKAGDVVGGALNMIGVRYRWGGNTPDSGLDCSGFVRYVFQDTLGLTLPRRAAEMSQVGKKVKISDLKPGDLVFFDTVRRTISHVGIYIGDNKFVHSPSTGSTIRVDELDSGYWEKRFIGGRRIDVSFHPQLQDGLKNRFGQALKTSDNN